MRSLIFAQNLIFDLEGTIIDPRWGIDNSLSYALHSIKVRPPREIRKFYNMNQSIEEILRTLLEKKEKQYLNRAMAHYRARYIKIGMFEINLYRNIEETLKILSTQGRTIYFITNKPQEFGEILLKNLEIKKYVDQIYGINLQEYQKTSKTDIVNRIINNNNLKKDYTMIIGDDIPDINAAKTNEIEIAAAMWGFGDNKKIKKASPDYFCYDAKEIIEILR